MTRDELKNQLRESIRTEESAVRVYYQHITTAVLRTPLPEQVKREVRDTAERLGRESARHRETLETMLEELQQDQQENSLDDR